MDQHAAEHRVDPRRRPHRLDLRPDAELHVGADPVHRVVLARGVDPVAPASARASGAARGRRAQRADALNEPRPSAWRAIVAGTVLNAPLGSLYAFSVFLKPLEALLGLSRAELAFVFGLASVGFAGGMNAAPYVYGLAPTPALVLACAVASTAGIALAATAGGLLQLAIGYSRPFRASRRPADI